MAGRGTGPDFFEALARALDALAALGGGTMALAEVAAAADLARPTARRALRSPKRSAIQEYERVSPTGIERKIFQARS